jgi:hypothetical protein
MGPMAKSEYLAAMYERYKKAGKADKPRAEKSRIIDEICATLGVHRKHAIRLLGHQRPGRALSVHRRGRQSAYAGAEVLKPLSKIWLAANLPCSKRLKAIVPLWIAGYEALEGQLAPDVRAKLLAISPSSIDRVLKHTRLKHTLHGRSTTKPGTLLRNKIPIATDQWQEHRPGFVEADTVAHCGGSMAGQFVYTLDCVDMATTWSEQRAVWAKAEQGVVVQMRSIEKALPFPLLGFDSDNGGEFINHALVRHFLSRQRPVQFTRSRAYHSDDNAHIEQKNWTHVRQWLGYDRLDNPAVVPLLNELYTNEWRLYHNFYCPSVKLISKERVGSRTVKTYDSPKTPYQRVLESPLVTDYAKRGLQRLFENTNPFMLRRGIEARLKRIFKTCYSSPVNNNTQQPLGNTNCEATFRSSDRVR